MIQLKVLSFRRIYQILDDVASQSMWYYDVTSGTMRYYLKWHYHPCVIRTLHHKPCNMNLWWSILDAKSSSEYEILFASKTSSLPLEYFSEIVDNISKIKPKRWVTSFFFSPKSYIVIFLKTNFSNFEGRSCTLPQADSSASFLCTASADRAVHFTVIWLCLILPWSQT